MLKNSMQQSKRVNGNRTQIMFDTLNNMYWRAPFEKIKLASKWIGLICKMREVYPKIYDAMRRKFVVPRLKLWHVNSIGHKAEETQKLTKWIEEKDQEIAKSLEMRRRNFIVKQFSKIERIEEIKKGLLLKFWNKTSKVIGFNEKAQLIAARVKGNSARARYNMEKNRQKLRSLTHRLYLRSQLNDIKDIGNYVIPLKANLYETSKSIENRLTINNLVSIGNNSVRTKILEIMTAKSSKAARIDNLKFWYTRWYKQVDETAKKENEAAAKIQKSLRSAKAKTDVINDKNKLRNMFRMYFITQLKEKLGEPARMNKQRYLIKLAFMHKHTNDKRTYRELVRKWRFHVMMMKFLKKKSENIYKHMHLNYLHIVNSLMGDQQADGFGNGNLYSEVDLLSTNMGLYKNMDPELLFENNEGEGLEESKYEKSNKFYKFFGVEYKPRSLKEEENEQIEDDNADIYGDINSVSNLNTRYNQTTNRSGKSGSKFNKK